MVWAIRVKIKYDESATGLMLEAAAGYFYSIDTTTHFQDANSWSSWRWDKLSTAIRYELGDNHIYDFVEGNIPWPMYPGIEKIALKDEPVYAFFDHNSPETGLVAYRHLEKYLIDEGPYDGVIAFSQAATMVLTYLIHVMHERKSGRAIEMPFKFAILLSIVQPPISYEALQQGQIKEVSLESDKGIVDIPTAHVWGATDEGPEGAARASQYCQEDIRWVHVHERGHEVPGSGSRVDVTRTVNIIRRAIETASNE